MDRDEFVRWMLKPGNDRARTAALRKLTVEERMDTLTLVVDVLSDRVPIATAA